jgi:NAD(P)-dependent dehydrogenase (short-subunit alcohol dehydrogenase family)
MAETLEGKVVLITGASGRIGLGMAQAFHAAGALVALGDLRQDRVEGAAADLGSERTFAGVVDVRDALSVRDFVAAAERALGPVDIWWPMPVSFQPSRCSTWTSRNGTA